MSKVTKQISLRQKYPLLIRKIFKNGIRSFLKAIAVWIIMAGTYIALSKLSSETWYEVIVRNSTLLIVFGFILLAFAFAYPTLYFITYHYDMDTQNMVIRKGVIARREIILPFSRITDINVEQDCLDVIFGLYRIHISTPTSESGKFAHVDGISQRSSLKLRSMLLERINSVGYSREQKRVSND